MEILSNYPQAVIDRAVSPSIGLAGCVAYPNLAKFRDKLETWADEHWAEVQRERRAAQQRLPEPPRDPEMEARVAKGLRELADQLRRGVGPSTIT